MLWNVLKLFLKLTTSSLKLQLSQTFGTLDPLALEAEQEPLPIKNYVWAPHTCARQCRCINSSWTGEWHGEWHGEWQVVSSPPHLAFSHVATCCHVVYIVLLYVASLIFHWFAVQECEELRVTCEKGNFRNLWVRCDSHHFPPQFYEVYFFETEGIERVWKSMKEYERVTKGHERHRKIPKDSVSRRVSELNGDQRSEGNRKK